MTDAAAAAAAAAAFMATSLDWEELAAYETGVMGGIEYRLEGIELG